MSYNEIMQRGTFDLPIELYKIDSSDPRYEMAHHWHTDFEIIRIISGTLTVSLNRRELIANAGDIVFVNPETVHGAHPTDCVYDCIVLSNEILKVKDGVCGNFISELLERNVLVNDHFKPDEKEIVNSFNSLFEIMKKGGSYFEATGALYTIFGMIIDKKLYNLSSSFPQEKATSQNAKIKKVLSFMRENYSSPLTLEQVASVAGMSSKYFCCFFKEMTRTSPIAYLNNYRIERAARKLLSTDMPITEIAFNCGFNDLSYFIKAFKSAKGVTPNKFRKQSV